MRKQYLNVLYYRYRTGRKKYMESETITQAKNYIVSHLLTQFTLDEIAFFCRYSTFHFAREFQKATGFSVMEFVRNERINAACNELVSGRNILDIALKYGFDTHTGFTNAFFRYTGCNPSNYRNHEQKANNYIKGEIEMDKSTVNIRMIEMNDVNDMWENVFSRNTPEEIKQRIQRDLDGFEEKTQFHVVAEVNRKVVGTLGLARINKYSCYANLGDYVIHPDYQGQGLARQMLEKIKEMLKDTKINTLQIQCGIDQGETKNKYIALGFAAVFESNGLNYLMMAL